MLGRVHSSIDTQCLQQLAASGVREVELQAKLDAMPRKHALLALGSAAMGALAMHLSMSRKRRLPMLSRRHAMSASSRTLGQLSTEPPASFPVLPVMFAWVGVVTIAGAIWWIWAGGGKTFFAPPGPLPIPPLA